MNSSKTTVNSLYRVAFLTTGLSYGGAETQLVQLAVLMKARGWDTLIISMLQPHAYTEELAAAKIPVISLNMRRGVPDSRVVLKLTSILRQRKPHILHSFMVHANILARVTRLMHWVPVQISSARNINEGGQLRLVAYRLTDPLCNLTTQVCQAGADHYVRVGAVPKKKIRMIPNGVETQRFKPRPQLRDALRAELGLGAKFAWLAVGRLEPQKNYPDLLNAFAQAATENPEAILLIAGQGPLRSVLEGLATALDLDEKVRFLGIRKDMPSVMNAADAYVMSSNWEGMANTLLEASATGLPIVATDVGGNREVVINRQSGLIVPPGDPGALSAAMQCTMSLSPAERSQIGVAGRAHIEANYSLDRVVEIWNELYKEQLAQRRIA